MTLQGGGGYQGKRPGGGNVCVVFCFVLFCFVLYVVVLGGFGLGFFCGVGVFLY